MAYTITKIPDGDVSLGNLSGEFVDLQPASADYATGGYAINSQEAVLNNPSLTANCDLYKIVAVLPAGNQGGYVPVWNSATGKLQIFDTGAASGNPLAQAAANTDLSAFTFRLLLIGN
jgi:hypothetical protein